MEWALTLNRHRLYDAWADRSTTIRFSSQNCDLGFRIIGASVKAMQTSGNLDAQVVIVLCGVAVGVVVCFFELIDFLEACNVLLAFSLWTAVKTYSLVTSLLFAEVADVPVLDKPLLFLTADHLEANELLPFLGLYTHDLRVEYLKETGHPERLQRLLEWHHGTVKKLPEKWEDAIYAVGLSIKKLTLDDGIRIQTSLPNIVQWFPNLTELTITDENFDASCLDSLQKLRHLKRLTVTSLTMGTQNFDQLYEALSRLRFLEVLKMPLQELSAEQIQKIAAAMPDLNTLAISGCTSEITVAHIEALKPLKSLTTFALEGNFRWHNGESLRCIGNLKQLTHLVLRPNAEQATLVAADIPSFHEMPQLEHLGLDRLPINDAILKQLIEHNTALHTLALRWCNRFTENGLCNLKLMPHLERLDLTSCNGVTDTAIRHVAECRRLKGLDVNTVHPASDEAIQTLQQCTLLEECSISGTRIASNGLKSITENCLELQTLTLQNSPFLESRDMVHVRKLPKLRSLSLHSCGKIDDLAVQEISQIASLKVFKAEWVNITNRSWIYWKGHSSLESLTIRGGRILPNGADIANLPPQLTYLDVQDAWDMDVQALDHACPHLKTLCPGGGLRNGIQNMHGVFFNGIPNLPQETDAFPNLERLSLPRMRFLPLDTSSVAHQFQKLCERPKMKRILIHPRLKDTCRIYNVALPPGVGVATSI